MFMRLSSNFHLENNLISCGPINATCAIKINGKGSIFIDDFVLYDASSSDYL